MTQDDEAARKSRAQKLRGQISKLKKDETEEEKVPDPREEPEKQPHLGKSPREFIQERMRELDKNNQ
jgi:hypothetical protein